MLTTRSILQCLNWIILKLSLETGPLKTRASSSKTNICQIIKYIHLILTKISKIRLNLKHIAKFWNA